MAIWDFFSGKKTTISAIVFLGNLIVKLASGENVDPAELGAAIIGTVGLVHKVVKALDNETEP